MDLESLFVDIQYLLVSKLQDGILHVKEISVWKVPQTFVFISKKGLLHRKSVARYVEKGTLNEDILSRYEDEPNR